MTNEQTDIKISISEEAQSELRNLLQSTDADTFVRVWVVGGGCCGVSYQMALDNEKGSDDIITLVDGIAVAVDVLSSKHLQDFTIEYLDELMGGGFRINNPKAKACGCGQSFTTETEEEPSSPCSSCQCK